MNIWGLKKKIKETRWILKEALRENDKKKVNQCEGRIRSLQSQIKKIKKERQNAKGKRR